METEAIPADHDLYNKLDTVYPPMVWTSRWSDGANIPLGLAHPDIQAIYRAVGMNCPDFYAPGLYLFSQEGHGIRVPHGNAHQVGVKITAYTRRHALFLFNQAMAIDTEVNPTPAEKP